MKNLRKNQRSYIWIDTFTYNFILLLWAIKFAR